MLLPLDGPSAPGTLAVTTTPVELKVGASALEERKVLTFQPQDGRIYYYFGDGVNTPSALTVATTGLLIFKLRERTIEASATQPIFVAAVAGTVNVNFAERA